MVATLLGPDDRQPRMTQMPEGRATCPEWVVGSS